MPTSSPAAAPERPTTAGGWLIWLWAVGGVLLILSQAVVRLGGRAVEIFDGSLTGGQWAVVAVWTVFMLYSEAWRGFHKQFSPRVVVRGLGIATRPRLPLVLFAPIVAMGLFHGTPKRVWTSRILLTGIVVLVLLVRMLPHPWRAIVDMGVVAGLVAGSASLVWFAASALAGRPPVVSAEFPEA